MADAEPPPPLTLAGGCLCGRTRYRVTCAGDAAYYCHCRMCQLAFGNTRAAFLNVAKADVHWSGEPPAAYAASKIARRGFCARCGTPLSFEYVDSPRMDLAVGSLDDPGAVRPTSHFAVESRITRWHAEDGLPGQRLDQFEPVMRRWREAYGDAVQPGLDAAHADPDS